MSTASTPDRRRTNHLILLSSLAIQLALLAYAAHVDANPVGGLKYTDVDWRVVYDGIMHTAHPRAGEVAEGPLALWLAERGVRIGSPYHRGTFRYTPLLVLVLSPALVAPVLGRLVLVALTLALPSLLLADPAVPFWTTHLLWTLNPIVLNITTRGSPEALACLLTAALVVFLRRAGLGSVSSKALRNPKSTNANTNAKPAMPAESRESAKWEAAAAVVLALAASYKIYPVIYVPAIWTALARRHGWFGGRVWRFGLIAGGTAVGVNAALWLVWGAPFLEHTFTYHLSRLDHRHNFSPYFLPIYLNLTSDPGSTPASLPLSLVLKVLRHPLASFLPQFSLVLGAGFALEGVLGVEGAMFFQTAIFVVFNKVCTSQYFLWPLPLVPLLRLPRLTWRTLLLVLAAWVGGQALWLSTAYRLEFLAEGVYLPLWGAGVALFAVSVVGLGVLLDGAKGEA